VQALGMSTVRPIDRGSVGFPRGWGVERVAGPLLEILK